MTPVPAIAGVVLAGGASSRFGCDKAEQIWRGRKLIDWSIAALAPFCGAIYVSGHAHATRESVPDRPRPGLGPLGGLAGALTRARDAGYGRLLSLPCDTPHLPGDLLASLAAAQSAAYVADCPVIGIWPTGHADGLTAWLADDRPRAVRAWAEAIGAKPLAPGAAIPNINRVGDLAQLENR